jgi:hypothetical protein
MCCNQKSRTGLTGYYRYTTYKDHVSLQDYEISDGMVSTTDCAAQMQSADLVGVQSLEMY